MEKFNVGDVVRLKSGGPNMTVEMDAETNHEFKGRVRCIWFEGRKQCGADFVPATLVKVEQTPFLLESV